MKKVLFAAFLLVSSHSMFAQVNQGQWLVGGSAGFNSSKWGDSDAGKETNIWVAPNIGYFLMDKLAAGVEVAFSSDKNKADDDAVTSFSAAPFVRYYFLDAGEKVNVFADAHYGFGSIGADDKVSFNEFQIKAGPAIFLTPNTALEFALYYKSQGGDRWKIGTEDERNNNFGLSIGFQIHLGGGSAGAKK
jgi:hypothetical protein